MMPLFAPLARQVVCGFRLAKMSAMGGGKAAMIWPEICDGLDARHALRHGSGQAREPSRDARRPAQRRMGL